MPDNLEVVQPVVMVSPEAVEVPGVGPVGGEVADEPKVEASSEVITQLVVVDGEEFVSVTVGEKKFLIRL